LPYPWWVEAEGKTAITESVKKLVAEAMGGRTVTFDDDEIRDLDAKFDLA
jgi:hypothetical protein